MDDKIYFLIKTLKEEMDKDTRFLLLKEKENKMNNDEGVIRLAIKKDQANDRYNDLLKIYPEDEPIVLEARKALIEAKDELNSHELVKDYLLIYNEVHILLKEMNNILFGDL